MQTSYEVQHMITPVLYPMAQKFLDDLKAAGGTPIYKLSVEDARAVLNGLQAGPINKLPVDIEDRVISAGPTGKLSIRILRPKSSYGNLPAIMYFHGGGWVLGNRDSHDRLIREIAHGTGAAVVFVNYTPSPEAKYPQPIEEAYAATKWVAENGKEIQVDSSRLAVAGDSVGGNMATVMTLLAKARGGPRLSCQVLFYPVTDANFQTGSYQQFAEGYFLSREAMKWFWDNYLPDLGARNQPTAAPLRAPLDQLKGVAPALVISGECDVLRDEGEAYARKLIEAGVMVIAVRYMGIHHDFVMLNAVSATPAARGAIAQANEFLRRNLVN
jgi:acetyl esterase